MQLHVIRHDFQYKTEIPHHYDHNTQGERMGVAYIMQVGVPSLYKWAGLAKGWPDLWELIEVVAFLM